MKKSNLLMGLGALAAAIALIVYAAGRTNLQTPPLPTATQTAFATPSATVAAVTPTPEPEPINRSVTTGFPTEQVQRPIAVIIENLASASVRPQMGLAEADIIYESLAEGGITRFMAIYNDQKPAQVGPVRSVRVYFLSLQKQWDIPIIHAGGPKDASSPDTMVYGPAFSDIKLRIDHEARAYSAIFSRVSDRKNPHNLMANIAKADAELYDYTPQDHGMFQFGSGQAPSAPDFQRVNIPFWSGMNFITYQHNPDDNRLYRSMGGKPFDTVTADGHTQQLSCANLIVQYTQTSVVQDASKHVLVQTVGTGAAEFFIGGAHHAGFWERQTPEDITRYTLADGTPLLLNPGNTIVELEPADKMISFE